MSRLYLNSIIGSESFADYNFLIVRIAKSVPKRFHHAPELIPPKSLFFRAQRWKKEGDMANRFEDYRTSFAQYMEQGELSEYLDHLEDLMSDDTQVQLICFCLDPSYRHRVIIGDYFFDKGFDVIYN